MLPSRRNHRIDTIKTIKPQNNLVLDSHHNGARDAQGDLVYETVEVTRWRTRLNRDFEPQLSKPGYKNRAIRRANCPPAFWNLLRKQKALKYKLASQKLRQNKADYKAMLHDENVEEWHRKHSA